MGGFGRTIQSIEVLTDHRVQILWTESDHNIADFRPIIEQGGVFTPLADPKVFAQVAVDSSGRFISWPGEIDFCADALYVASTSLAER